MPFELRRRIMRILRSLSIAIVLLAAGPVSAYAQHDTSLLIGGGAMNFDLSGTGTAPAFTARISRELGANVVVEGGFLVARPDQQLGNPTIVAPEVQLQYHFPLGRFTPYLGAGVGAMRESAIELGDIAIGSEWSPTIAFAGGTRVSVNDRLGLFGELRVRGVEWNFAGSTADITGGVAVRLGR